MVDQNDDARMTDELDRANALSEQLRAAAETAARRLSAPEEHPEFDGKHCVGFDDTGCGVEIPQARLSLGKVRCIECQQRLEHRRRIYGD